MVGEADFPRRQDGADGGGLGEDDVAVCIRRVDAFWGQGIGAGGGLAVPGIKRCERRDGVDVGHRAAAIFARTYGLAVLVAVRQQPQGLSGRARAEVREGDAERPGTRARYGNGPNRARFSGFVYFLHRFTPVGADEFHLAVDHHLRGVNPPRAPRGGIGPLALGAKRLAEGVFPVEVVPIGYMAAQRDDVVSVVQFIQHGICGRA